MCEATQRFKTCCSDFVLPQVVRIDRVQNQRLWAKYCIRKAEVEEAAGVNAPPPVTHTLVDQHAAYIG